MEGAGIKGKCHDAIFNFNPIDLIVLVLLKSKVYSKINIL